MIITQNKQACSSGSLAIDIIVDYSHEWRELTPSRRFFVFFRLLDIYLVCRVVFL